MKQIAEVTPYTPRAQGQDKGTRPAEILPRYLTAAQAAAYIGSTEGTIRVWTCQRKIPFIKRGRMVRYDRLALDALMQRGAVKVASVWQK